MYQRKKIRRQQLLCQNTNGQNSDGYRLSGRAEGIVSARHVRLATCRLMPRRLLGVSALRHVGSKLHRVRPRIDPRYAGVVADHAGKRAPRHLKLR